MDDLISRQEILRTLPNLCIGFDCRGCPFYDGNYMTHNCLLKQRISSLPSALPRPEGFDPEHLTEQDKKDILEALDWVKGTITEEVPSAQPDRDIPRKPIEGCSLSRYKKVKEASCPNCNFFLSHFRFYGEGKRITYCEHCGQAIDWEGWEWDD